MTEAKFCPFCHKENSQNATHCQHCGVPLATGSQPLHTTLSLGQDSFGGGNGGTLSCHDLGLDLPSSAFALFLLEFKQPIVVTKQPKIIIGRDESQHTDRFLDMSQYGEMSLGLSRRHAQISYGNGRFTIEDLDSTNGTWVNKTRIHAGQAVHLRPSDRIWLGPLQALFCYGEESQDQSAAFFLKPDREAGAAGQQLTPNLLANQVAPYLTALAELEQLVLKLSGQSAVAPAVLSIEQGDRSVAVNMIGASQAAPLVVALVEPWRVQNGRQLLASETKAAGERLLQPLARRTLDHIQLLEAAPPREALVRLLLPLLLRLITCRLKLSTKS